MAIVNSFLWTKPLDKFSKLLEFDDWNRILNIENMREPMILLFVKMMGFFSNINNGKGF